MAYWLNLGQIQKLNAKKFPETVALKDKSRAFTYPQMNKRVNQLAQSLNSLGLQKGDKVAVLLENSIEIVEVFLATAKTGIIIVPINFRLVSPEVEYIVNNSDAKALVVHDQFVPIVEPIRANLKNIQSKNYFVVGQSHAGYQDYETFIKDAPDTEPEARVEAKDTWVLIYTSGTTGKPKGVIRSHESHIAYYLNNAVDFGFNENDVILNVMPLCHINSIFFTFTFLGLKL
jgi:acyl-CoA synthetase (AMP-forming)/AMP-acid ligase II